MAKGPLNGTQRILTMRRRERVVRSRDDANNEGQKSAGIKTSGNPQPMGNLDTRVDQSAVALDAKETRMCYAELYKLAHDVITLRSSNDILLRDTFIHTE